MQKRSKKLIQINTVCNTSTGRIMGDIQREAMRQGYETLSIVGRRQPFKDIPCVKIGNGIAFWTHVIINTVFDRQGYASWYETYKIVKRLRKEKPDIIHLHNLHGYYLNLPMLFSYLKKEFKGKIFWTFHDCWPFTGHCAYFTLAQCEKWKEHCHHCPNKKNYPVSWFADNSESNYRDKKEMFTELSDMTIIVPSKWMADLVKQSFMKEYPLEVVSNGIDTELFSCVKKKEIYDKYSYTLDTHTAVAVKVYEDYKRQRGTRQRPLLHLPQALTSSALPFLRQSRVQQGIWMNLTRWRSSIRFRATMFPSLLPSLRIRISALQALSAEMK